MKTPHQDHHQAQAGQKDQQTMTDQTPIDTAAAVPVKRSLEDKIALTRALLAKYETELNAEKQINNVLVGDDIDFSFGRADKARTLTGIVQAVGDTDQGRVVAVLTGEGIDIETKRVRADAIVENRTAAARLAAETPSEEAPVEAPADDSDPLAAE